MSPGIMAMLAAALGFISVAGFGFAFAGDADNAKMAQRAKLLARENRDAERARRAVGNDANSRRKALLATLKEADKKQRKARLSLTAKLQQAGLTASPRSFWILSVGLAVGAAAIAMLLRAPPLIALGLGFGLGLGFPRWLLGFLGKRRLRKYTEEFPNAIDVIVRGVKSGLPVHDCLKMIAKESPAPLGPEFRRLVENIGMGMSVEQALEKSYERMPTAELRFFTIVLAIQQKAGGNLAEALGNLSNVLRSRKLMREKIKALSSEATASAMIIAALPPGVMLLVTVMTPSYMEIMFTDPRGHMMLAGGAIWMGIGGFVMRRMINFKF
jgi:tight adherence protein B